MPSTIGAVAAGHHVVALQQRHAGRTRQPLGDLLDPMRSPGSACLRRSGPSRRGTTWSLCNSGTPAAREGREGQALQGDDQDHGRHPERSGRPVAHHRKRSVIPAIPTVVRVAKARPCKAMTKTTAATPNGPVDPSRITASAKFSRPNDRPPSGLRRSPRRRTILLARGDLALRMRGRGIPRLQVFPAQRPAAVWASSKPKAADDPVGPRGPGAADGAAVSVTGHPPAPAGPVQTAFDETGSTRIAVIHKDTWAARPGAAVSVTGHPPAPAGPVQTAFDETGSTRIAVIHTSPAAAAATWSGSVVDRPMRVSGARICRATFTGRSR